MSEEKTYLAVLFNSVSHAIMAENILKSEEIPHKLIPVPRHISSDCGVCLRIESDQEKTIKELLASRVDISEICNI